MNQKLFQFITLQIQKILTFTYFVTTLWLSGLLILFIPIWVPFYLCVASVSRTFNFIKKIIELPTSIYKPKVTEPIQYAILKGNGKYLKTDSDLVFTYQLYDYTVRKFMSVQEINPKLKIAQIQCENLAPLKYMKNQGVKNIISLQSHPQIFDKQKQNSEVQIIKESYQINEFSNEYDCIIAFNLKQKLNKQKGKAEISVDILAILAYIRHHLSSTGYAIFGDYVQEGQIKVLEQLFQVYGFKVQEQQNIQKNILHAQKLKQQRNKFWQQKLLESTKMKLMKLLNIYRDSTKPFQVFILTKEE